MSARGRAADAQARARSPLGGALGGVRRSCCCRGSRLDTVLESRILRVGTTGDYRPFTVLDKTTGEYSGFDVDMARSLAQALGVQINFVPTTWSKLAGDLSAGAFDIAMGGVSVTLDRQKQAFSPRLTCATARPRSRAARIRRSFRRWRRSTAQASR